MAKFVLLVFALAAVAGLLIYGLWAMDRIIRTRRAQLSGST